MPFEKNVLRTEVGTEGEATAGDAVIVKGVMEVPSRLQIIGSIKSSMPGAMGLPFSFSIQECSLAFVAQSSTVLWYAAPDSEVTAKHSMLGSVLSEGDHVGIMINRRSGLAHWYVDNSIHNHRRPGTMVWSRAISAADGVQVIPRYEKMVAGNSTYKAITYGGAYDGKFRFTLDEFSVGQETSKEFFFTINENGSTLVAIKGVLFEITYHDSVLIRYKVLNSFD